MKKTNAARLLDQQKIAYEIVAYEVDESDLSATHVAQSIGQDINMVFKTLVARGDKGQIIMACIPGNQELSLKKLAKLAKFKKVEMIQLKELQPLTGYIRGGCSPLGAKKNFPVFLHESAVNYPKIAISAGIRGQQILIDPQDLIKVVKATIGDLIQ